MIPFNIRLLLDDNNSVVFQSNEKPGKGDLFTIEDESGKSWPAKVTDVTRVVIKTKKEEAVLEYRCKVERHEQSTVTIGFGKRN